MCFTGVRQSSAHHTAVCSCLAACQQGQHYAYLAEHTGAAICSCAHRFRQGMNVRGKHSAICWQPTPHQADNHNTSKGLDVSSTMARGVCCAPGPRQNLKDFGMKLMQLIYLQLLLLLHHAFILGLQEARFPLQLSHDGCELLVSDLLPHNVLAVCLNLVLNAALLLMLLCDCLL